MYQALYRKYRPKNFDDVVGQEHITVTLKQEISSGRVGHAYLFTGSRGTGKTTCSKIIAKAVNCPNQQDGNCLLYTSPKLQFILIVVPLFYRKLSLILFVLDGKEVDLTF